MNLIALPASAASRKWTVWLLAPGIALVAVTLFWALSGTSVSSTPVASSMIYRVVPMDLDVKIIKDGELQAINNIDINCEVEGQTTILTVVDEGSAVKKGDILMTLDSSAIRQKIDDTSLTLQQAEADLTAAREMEAIQESQNATNLEAAQVALQLAQLDVKQYEEGTYPQLLASAKTDLEMAQINLKNSEEKLGQTRTLFAKQFVTATAVKDDELAVTTARNAVDKADTALKVLTEYTHQMDLASKQSALTQAEQKLVRTKRENAANLAQKTADTRAKEQSLSLLKRRMERYQEQLAACTIKAPADGLVVYATSGDRNAQNPIQEGATVRERQALLRLPDTSSMKAVVRIQEAQVPKLRLGQRATVKIVGVPHPIGATITKISVLADNSQRWWNPDLREYPVDLTLDETPSSLKPGMRADAQVFVDRAHNVLAVPLAAIYAAGRDTYVFARQDDRFVPREVKIGRTNDTHAELLGDVVKSGDEVLLLQSGQGQELLEKAGIKVEPATQPHDPGQPPARRGAGRDRGNGPADGANAPAPDGSSERLDRGSRGNDQAEPSNGSSAPLPPQSPRQHRRQRDGASDSQSGASAGGAASGGAASGGAASGSGAVQ